MKDSFIGFIQITVFFVSEKKERDMFLKKYIEKNVKNYENLLSLVYSSLSKECIIQLCLIFFTIQCLAKCHVKQKNIIFFII